MEKPLEKKAGRNYGPPGTKKLIYFIDDMNMPEVCKQSTLASTVSFGIIIAELLRLIIETEYRMILKILYKLLSFDGPVSMSVYIIYFKKK